MQQDKKFTEKELVLATHNAGKAREISDLLAPYVENFHTAAELDLEEPEETGETFEENAVLKARLAAKASGKPALSDDSGLCVYALGGAPGIHSARWAEVPGQQGRDFNMAMEKVHNTLGDNMDRRAAFVCVLALAWPDGEVRSFEGRIEGKIVWPGRGKKGFGYDPVFVPEGHDITFAEMEPEEKHGISHRARAFEKLIPGCFSSS